MMTMMEKKTLIDIDDIYYIRPTTIFLRDTMLITTTTHSNSDLGLFLFTFQVPGVAVNRPSVLRGDALLAYPIGKPGVKYRGYVHSIQQDSVKLGFDPK